MLRLKKCISVLLMILTLSSVFTMSMTFSATEANGSTSGIWKDWDDNEITWTFDGVDKLTFSGEGKIQDNELGRYNGSDEMAKFADKVKSIYVQDGITEVSYPLYVFDNVKNIVIGDGVTKVGWATFNSCDTVENITLADSVTEVGSFEDCKKLKSIVIPNGVKELNYQAFRNCYNLKTAKLSDNITEIPYSGFENCKNLTSVEFSNNTKIIYNKAFKNCKKLKSVTIPKTTTVIKSEAFRSCENIKTVNIPENVTKIGKYAFTDCKKLSNITVDKNNKNFANVNGSLYNKNKDTLITYPCGKGSSYSVAKGTKYIGERAFSNATVKKITLPNTVNKINTKAFENCTNLNNISIPTSVTYIASGAFNNTKYYNTAKNWNGGQLYISNCIVSSKKNIKKANVKAGTRLIASGTYSDRKNLSSVTLPNGLKYINSNAFLNCEKVTKVTLPKSLKKIGTHALGYTHGYVRTAYTDYSYEPYAEMTLASDTITLNVYKNSVGYKYAKNSYLNYELVK